MTMEVSDQQRIGERYDLQRVLGIGGMARVYLAHDRTLNRDVAVKMLNPALVADPVFVERFRREARAAAALNHPNIVTIYDTGTSDGTYYIVMEYVPGPNLKEALRGRGPLSEREALLIGAQIAAALDAAHAQGLIHRDIKSHNVLIGPGEHVKVTDFGIARAAGASQLTATQTVMGSAQYLSPEQALHQPLDGRSDLYSLGVVLYEALTGQLPFTGDSLVAVAMRHVHDQPTPPRTIRPEISPQTEAVVMKALAKDPAQRYQSAAAMRDALLHAAEPHAVTGADLPPIATTATATAPLAAPLPVPPASPPPLPPPVMVAEPPAYEPPARGRWLLVPLLAALLLLGIGGAFFATHRNGGVASTVTPAGPTRVAGASGTLASAPTVTPTARATQAPTAANTPVPPTAPPIPTAAPTLAPTVPAAVPTIAPTVAPTPTPLAPPTATPEPAPTATLVPPTATPQPPAPTAAPPSAVSADTPAGAVQQFYQLAAQHNFDAAAQLWSPRMKAEYPVDENLVGHFNPAKEVDVRIGPVQTNDAAGRATVAVDVTEVRTAAPFSRRYVGSWQLVRGPNGWLLDQPNLSPA